MSDEPEFTNWQDAWEHYARAELGNYRSWPAADLLAAVRAGRFGGHYVLWEAIAERASLEQAAGALMKVLGSGASYLDRYHCAAALLRLMGRDPADAVHFCADVPERQARLAALGAELAQRIGAQ